MSESSEEELGDESQQLGVPVAAEEPRVQMADLYLHRDTTVASHPFSGNLQREEISPCGHTVGVPKHDHYFTRQVGKELCGPSSAHRERMSGRSIRDSPTCRFSYAQYGSSTAGTV